MLYRDISRILALFCFGFAATLLIPIFLAIYYQFFVDPHQHPQPHTTLAFIQTFLVCLLIATGFYFGGKGASGHLYRREGLAIVVLIWLLTPAISALPFIFSGTLKNPFSAYFEATSGLTTCGATAMEAKHYDPVSGKEIPIVFLGTGPLVTTYSYFGTIEPIRDPLTKAIVIEGIEAVSKALLFWRSFMQWLGGVGIVVLFVAILPLLGAGGRVLFQAEVPGPIKESLTPRIKETAINLWMIYIALTMFIFVLLIVTNAQMEWLDAVTVTFAAISTGGFSIRNASIGYYNNAATEWIVILSMLLGSINFSFYYYTMKGKFFRIFEPEFIVYVGILILTCGLTSWFLIGSAKDLLTEHTPATFQLADSLRYGTFQVVSAITTTGFATANYDIWPYAAQAIMLVGMFVGGMSGSTSSGIKIMRLYLLYHIAKFKVESLFSPRRVQTLKAGDKEVDAGAIIMVLCFFLLIISVSVAATLIYIMDGIGPSTALGLVASMVNGTGLSFRAAGPLSSCAFMSNFDYVFSCLLMIMGRLEFFAIFALLVPAFWKSNE